jgi:hypothetical protein
MKASILPTLRYRYFVFITSWSESKSQLPSCSNMTPAARIMTERFYESRPNISVIVGNEWEGCKEGFDAKKGNGASCSWY